MANIFGSIKPEAKHTKPNDTYYVQCRLYNDLLSRFNVAFILGNEDIEQGEFFDMIQIVC